MPRAALIGVIVLLLGLAPAGAADAGGGGHSAKHSITVLGPDSSNVLTTFTSATCRRKKDVFYAKATSTDHHWKLLLRVPNFTGYDADYDIPFGVIDLDQPGVSISPVGEGLLPIYANEHHPSYPVPGFGEVAFRKKGRLLGIGFGPAMYDQDGQSAISFTGVVTCHGKKKKN